MGNGPLQHILPNILTIYAFCIAESAVRFDGKGYLKYLYQIKEGNKNFHLSLRLKTSATEGTVMTTNASDWGTLEVTFLKYSDKRIFNLFFYLPYSCTKGLF